MNSSTQMKHKIIVLTDFSTHGEGESIYSLLQEMSQHECCQEIFVVSRHRKENANYYLNFSSDRVYGKPIDKFFSYDLDGSWYKVGVYKSILEFDVVFLRLDRPVSNKQLDCLKDAFKNKLIINDPDGIQKTGSKEFLLEFPELTPPCGLISSFDEAMVKSQSMDIVLKPIEGYGGIGLVYIGNNKYLIGVDSVDINTFKSHVDSYLSQAGYMLWMKYMKNVSKGDKRVLVVSGEVLGATLRLPSKDSWLCNLKQGGSAAPASIDDEEYNIAQRLIPRMKENGVVIFGFDTLVDDDGKRILSEINTLNVGGLLQAQEFSKQPVVSMASKSLWSYICSSVKA